MTYTLHQRRTLTWADGGHVVEDYPPETFPGTAEQARASRIHRLREAKSPHVKWQMDGGVLTITRQCDLGGPCVEETRLEWTDAP